MDKIRIGVTTLQVNKKKIRATIESVYGIGRIKSSKIIQMLLTNPKAKQFKTSLVSLSQELFTQRIFKAVVSDTQLKLNIYSNLEKIAKIGCYRGHRILQNLPAKGQRTHTNAGTPNRLNPFVVLGVKTAKTEELKLANKKWELNWNGRSSDLVDFSVTTGSKKYSRKASLEKQKQKQKKKLNSGQIQSKKNKKK